MSHACFVTNEGFPLLHKDMEESDLSVSEYWKMVCTARDGCSMTAVKHIIACIDAHINGCTTELMREWTNHREQYTDLDDSLVEWRIKCLCN